MSMFIWQNVAMIISLTLLLSRLQIRSRFDKWFVSGKFDNTILLTIAIIGISALIGREIYYNPIDHIQTAFPTLTYFEQLVVWQSTTHLRSFLFYAAMIFYLWYKWNAFLPAAIAGWFGLGFIELTFIPQQLITNGGFLGFNWYYPFIGCMFMFVVMWTKEHAYTVFTKKFVLIFGLGVFVQYALLVFRPWGFTIFDAAHSNTAIDLWNGWNNAVLVNQAILPHPPWQTWMWEFLNHLMKSLMTIAFCCIEFHGLRSTKNVQPNN